MNPDFYKELDAAITVCDTEGLILYMNDRSIETFKKDGGSALIGKNLFDCHEDDASVKLKNLLQKKESNSYTIEKNGIKKMIYQTPWFDNSEYKGFIEFSFILPGETPHFIRK